VAAFGVQTLHLGSEDFEFHNFYRRTGSEELKTNWSTVQKLLKEKV
jgi:hypothetical protein